jgi:hypothetical protein
MDKEKPLRNLAMLLTIGSTLCACSIRVEEPLIKTLTISENETLATGQMNKVLLASKIFSQDMATITSLLSRANLSQDKTLPSLDFQRLSTFLTPLDSEPLEMTDSEQAFSFSREIHNEHILLIQSEAPTLKLFAKGSFNKTSKQVESFSLILANSNHQALDSQSQLVSAENICQETPCKQSITIHPVKSGPTVSAPFLLTGDPISANIARDTLTSTLDSFQMERPNFHFHVFKGTYRHSLTANSSIVQLLGSIRARISIEYNPLWLVCQFKMEGNLRDASQLSLTFHSCTNQNSLEPT